MFCSLGAMAAESWHGLSCSPPSFTNWQNVFVVMLAALKTHRSSKPASQSTGSNDAVALQHSWPLCLTAGHCVPPGQQAQGTVVQRLLPPLSRALF